MTTMRSAVAVLLLAAAVSASPVKRKGDGLSAVGFIDPTEKWHQIMRGEPINYVIADKEIESISLGGLGEWEKKTCIKFNRCEQEAGCKKPYILFHLSEGCQTTLGMNWDEVSDVWMSVNCGAMGAAHEIGHVLGFSHEQTRNDRDEFVHVDFGATETDSQFEKTGERGRDLYEYDYESIMHYSKDAFSDTTSIYAPVEIGLDRGLTPKDVAAFHFLYNTCSTTFERPRCAASRKTDILHRIPHSKDWTVEFNVLYKEGESIWVTYPATTAPGVRFSVRNNYRLRYGHVGKTLLTYRAGKDEIGKRYTLAATFTAADGKQSTCSVEVEVADSDKMCWSVPGDDPSVCSGLGECTDNTPLPCVCAPGIGGNTCGFYSSCKHSYVEHFDDVHGYPWSDMIIVGTDVKVVGTGAARITKGYTSTKVDPEIQPAHVSFYGRLLSTSDNLQVEIRSENSYVEFNVGRYRGRFIVSSASGSQDYGRVVANTWYHFVVVIDWSSRTGEVSIDGKKVGQPFALPADFDRVVRVSRGGEGYLDELELHCQRADTIPPGPREGVTPAPTPPPSPATPEPEPETPEPEPETPKPAPSVPVPVPPRGSCRVLYADHADNPGEWSHSSVVAVTTRVKKAGSGSLEFKKPWITSSGIGPFKPTHVSFYARISSREAGVSVGLGDLRISVGDDKFFSVLVGSSYRVLRESPAYRNRWYFIEVVFDWEGLSAIIFVNEKELTRSSLPEDIENGIEELSYGCDMEGKCYLDEVVFEDCA